MEQIINYQDMSSEQRRSALYALDSIGFHPAHGKIKTMQNIMDKSVEDKMPQFYFVFRDKELIGYLFLIGDEKKFRAFPWIAIDNLDELPMRIVEPLADIAIKAWNNEEGIIVNADGSHTEKKLIALNYKQRLENYKCGIGRRNERETR
ncbi:hypothetical protein [uncultured Clostridium sp.]|uniref:hypothetical protein n=1 Tax=uncultured Clostridium sp. TaxID=59620 RepID=UPI0025E97233|nr:hypothetical protein [uncultured Clostridium sp.]